MIDLILTIVLIISLLKPEVLLSKKMKELANDEQKKVLSSNLRKFYAVLVGVMESIALVRYNEAIGSLLSIVCIILFFTVALPAIKKIRTTQKELGL